MSEEIKFTPSEKKTISGLVTSWAKRTNATASLRNAKDIETADHIKAALILGRDFDKLGSEWILMEVNSVVYLADKGIKLIPAGKLSNCRIIKQKLEAK